MLLKFFLFLTTFFLNLYAQEIVDISKTNEAINLIEFSHIYIDKNSQKNFEEVIQSKNKLFDNEKKDFLHFGYTSATIWLFFSLKNSSHIDIDKVIKISNQMLDSIHLYIKNKEGEYISYESGVNDRHKYSKGIVHTYFDISLKPGERKDYYLKVSSLSSALYFKVLLLNKEEFYQQELQYQLVLTLFFGSILTLIIYNLFIYFFTKESVYLYYIFYLLFVILEHASYTTLNFYIFPQELLEMDAYFSIYYISGISIFSILFIREYLNIKEYRKIDTVFKFFIVYYLLLTLFSSRSFYPLEMAIIFGVILMIYILVVNIYLLYKGVENAKYMILGWSIAIFGWVMISTYNFGTWSLLNDYPYFFEFSIFAEAILFSVALVRKLNKTKELEKAVQTNDILTKELHHRVKNNMQFIISMYRLKLAQFANPKLIQALQEVEGTIQAMSMTHEMLYTQNKKLTLDTKNYIELLVKRVEKNYHLKVNVTVDVNASVSMDNSIYIGIILNELLTNSFKYAFKEKANAAIKVTLYQEDSYYKLIVEDNGVGCDYQDNRETFGLDLIESLVKDELGGTIQISNVDGCQCIITWR